MPARLGRKHKPTRRGIRRVSSVRAENRQAGTARPMVSRGY